MGLFLHQYAFRKSHLLKLLFCIGAALNLSLSTYAVGVCTVNKFNTATLIPVNASPRQILFGDVNSDNTRDMVVFSGTQNSGSANTATVLLNDGSGNFKTFTSLSFNFTASTGALADFNQDGSVDLVVGGTNNFSGNPSPLVIFINNGDGVFSQQTTLNVQGASSAVEAGDFNADGLTDIAVALTTNNNFGAIALFLNNGFGSFAFAGNFNVGGQPRDLKIADINNDGVLDAVTVSNNSTISVLLGSRSGTFQVPTNFVYTTNSFSSPVVGLGDLNNDNFPDFVIGNTDSTSYFVILNNNGAFTTPSQVTFSDFNLRIRSIAVGQAVGDSNLDVVFGVSSGSSDSPSQVAIVQGNGSGIFTSISPILAPTGAIPVYLALADLNNDGINDISTANSLSGDVSILINNNGRFGPNTFPATPASNVVAAGDFNGDGNLDVVTGSTQIPSSGSPNLLISFGNGAGGMSGTQNFGFTNPVQALIAADVNRDSRVDIIAATGSSFNGSNTIALYLNSGSSTIFPNIPSSSVPLNFLVKNMVSGDFNNDSITDFAVGSQNSNSFALILGAAGGTLLPAINYAAPVNAPPVAAGNFNTDGNLDLAIAGTPNSSSSSGTIFTLLGNGSGGFTQVNESLTINNPISITSGNFNGDSLTDIAVTNLFSSSNSSNTAVTVAFGTGNGRLTLSASYPGGLEGRFVTTADLNGDGRQDLVVANRASNSYSVLTNAGNGIFRAAANFLAGVLPEAVALGDFNNDSRNDVVSINRGGNNFSLSLNNCLEAVTKTDYTGDGKTDFAVVRRSNGTWYVRDAAGAVESRQFGMEGDIAVPGDYDGDGTTDFAVFRPSNSTWYIARSSNNLMYSVKWGTTGDIPTANDFDGDGRTDIAVFRPSNGVWYVIRSTNPNEFYAVQFGAAGDRPVAADYDGDGRADFAVFRPSNGVWYLLQSRDGFAASQFGIGTDRPVPGDYDGDGKTDLGVYRDGVWFILLSKTRSLRVENFGLATDVPQLGDYDGDGRTDIAVYRPSNSNWYLIQSSDRAFRSVAFGNPNDAPVSSIYLY